MHVWEWIKKTCDAKNLNVSRLVLELSLPNPLNPGVKSRMKMQLDQRRQNKRCSNYIRVINNFIAY